MQRRSKQAGGSLSALVLELVRHDATNAEILRAMPEANPRSLKTLAATWRAHLGKQQWVMVPRLNVGAAQLALHLGEKARELLEVAVADLPRLRVDLDDRTLGYLNVVAKERRVPPRKLAARLLAAIARSDLVDAVLDERRRAS